MPGKKLPPDGAGKKGGKIMTELERIQKEQREAMEARKRKVELPGGVLPEPQRAEHIEPKTFKEKWTNYWYHYKWLTFGVAFFGILGIALILQILFPTKYDTAFSVVSMLPMDTVQDVLSAPLLTEMQDYDGNGEKLLDLQFYQIPRYDENGNPTTDPQVVMANTTRLMGNLSLGTYFLYLVDDSGYDYLLGAGVEFMDLTGRIDGAEGDKYSMEGTRLAEKMGYPDELAEFSLVFLNTDAMGDRMEKKDIHEAYERQWDFFEALVAVG